MAHDVVIVGGGPAGLSAALALGRARKRVLGAILAASLGSCASRAQERGADHPHGAPDHHGGHHGFHDAEAWAKVFDDPARDAWQQPDAIVRAMELMPDMHVADVGAGTGYFSVRLARALPAGEVLATDVEPDMVRFLAERAQREGLANLRAVRASPSASGLSAGSVDRILLVDVWHHVADRRAYARDLAAALRPGGRILIVDFKLEAEHGPPRAMRLAADAIEADLAGAGLAATILPLALPDQYVVEARRR